MPHLDQFGSYVIAAFLVTVLLLGGYTAYLWSRLNGLERQITFRQAEDAEKKPTAEAGAP